MAAITISDLRTNRTLDRKSMSFIRGGGAPWVFGSFQPYVSGQPSFGPVVNFYQTTNNFYADQMNNQIQVVDIHNSAPNSNIKVDLAANGSNTKML